MVTQGNKIFIKFLNRVLLCLSSLQFSKSDFCPQSSDGHALLVHEYLTASDFEHKLPVSKNSIQK